MMGRKTKKDYEELGIRTGFKWVGPDVDNNKTPTGWQCQNGHTWLAPYKRINKGHGCPYCAGTVKRDEGYYHIIAHEHGFVYLGPYPKGVNTKTKWQCQDGHVWLSTLSHIREGKGCPYCSGNVRKTVEDYKQLGVQAGFIWIGPLVSVSDTTTWQCPLGHQWQSNFNNIKRGHGCPYCAGTIPKTRDDYYELAKRNGLKWIGPEVPNTGTKTAWQCQRGHKWFTTFSNIQTGYSCPICLQSRGERAVAGLLDSFNIHYETQKRFDKCRHKNPLPFDFYFYLNSVHFLIEYDGIQHFEPGYLGRGDLDEIKYRDEIKSRFAHEYGFVLIRISYLIKEVGRYLKGEIEKVLNIELEDLRDKSVRINPPQSLTGWQLDLL